MHEPVPVTEICPEFASPGATPTPWEHARTRLAEAPLCWVTNVRPDGRPHATPLLSVWVDGSVCFCTGPEERKAVNLSKNPHCAMSTGDNSLEGGPDVIVEGTGAPVEDHAELGRIADAYERKYGASITSEDGTWFGLGDAVRKVSILTVRVTPAKAFAFNKAPVFSQTRYTFTRPRHMSAPG